jgi:hypothetical protein
MTKRARLPVQALSPIPTITTRGGTQSVSAAAGSASRLPTPLESVKPITSRSTPAASRRDSNRNNPETGFGVTPTKQTTAVLSNRNKKTPPGGVTNSPTKSPTPKGDKRDPSGRLRPQDDGREKLSRPEPLTVCRCPFTSSATVIEPAIPQEWRRSRIEEWNEKSSGAVSLFWG